MARNNELFGMAKSGGKLILSLFGSITQKTTTHMNRDQNTYEGIACWVSI